MLVVLGYAMVLASQLALLSVIEFGWKYLLMSVLFLAGYALIFYSGKGVEE